MIIKQSNKKGFTLIELLVVISIIGLLSSVVLASLSSARQRARDVYVISSINSYITAFKAYYADHGYYPGDYDALDNNGACIGDECESGDISEEIKNQMSSYIPWVNPSPYEKSPYGGIGGANITANVYYVNNTADDLTIKWFKNPSSDCGIPGAQEFLYSPYYKKFCWLSI